MLKMWIINGIFDHSDTQNGRDNIGTAVLVWIGIELVRQPPQLCEPLTSWQGLCSVAGFLVCYVESCAAGSGIPEIKVNHLHVYSASYEPCAMQCRLNGIRMKRVLRLKTYFTKVLC